MSIVKSATLALKTDNALYTVILKNSAEKQLDSLPDSVVERVLKHIEALKVIPRPHGTKKLTDGELFRLRVGEYRILYDVDDRAKTVIVLDIEHRSKVYRKKR
ncbi:MAG: type II toxin-antitoxin system RelE family toxin [Candidatus Kapaibacteriota bacterium]|jgi:mRNA interferase RelE/StbE